MNAATVAAILPAAAVASYGLFYFFRGELRPVLKEIAEGEFRTTFQLFPDPRGLITLIGAAMVISGLLTRKLLIAWLGLAFLLGFSALFLFSIGASLLPLAGILLILLTIITIFQRNIAQIT